VGENTYHGVEGANEANHAERIVRLLASEVRDENEKHWTSEQPTAETNPRNLLVLSSSRLSFTFLVVWDGKVELCQLQGGETETGGQKAEWPHT